MNMVFTWETQNLCIIFPQWQITDTLSLIWSLCIIVLVTAGYELLRNASRRYEARCAQLAIRLPDDDHEDPSSLIHPGKPQTTGRDTTKPVRAAFYTAQVLYSFFIM
ncbi:MAG: hypothetical protein M1838_000734 [Thelocarpon superellum]|nr:MAG: hypothetical protein M1838_000734 [Thelocarpon superellum]